MLDDLLSRIPMAGKFRKQGLHCQLLTTYWTCACRQPSAFCRVSRRKPSGNHKTLHTRGSQTSKRPGTMHMYYIVFNKIRLLAMICKRSVANTQSAKLTCKLLLIKSHSCPKTLVSETTSHLQIWPLKEGLTHFRHIVIMLCLICLFF